MSQVSVIAMMSKSLEYINDWKELICFLRLRAFHSSMFTVGRFQLNFSIIKITSRHSCVAMYNGTCVEIRVCTGIRINNIIYRIITYCWG